ncbi:TetR/AcrR family transcriptional regulator [Streptacidiphilus sp. EB103A]|uniref:TetR/AcrR family transcriptional regulator n=1 Tax=Streptacidiphilus sp. EB103A TaxID=3156275 RepID=UPI003514DD91
MTVSQLPAPQRSHARSNRARILATAREELSRNADASLDELARAAGVARRTLYGHFPNRQVLVAALAEEATASVEQAFTAARRPDDDPVSSLARVTLAVWAVGDRYRMLISLARRDLGEEGIRAALAPARAEVTSILERGQVDGVIADHVPAPVLSQALEALTLALIEAQNAPGWSDPAGEAAALSLLLAAGVPCAAARDRVHAILAEAGRGPESLFAPQMPTGR